MREDDLFEIQRLRDENARLHEQLNFFDSLGGNDIDALRQRDVYPPLKAVVDTLTDGVLISRASDSEIIYANERMARLLGYSSGEFVGKKAVDLRLWADPDDRDRFLAYMTRRGVVDDFVTQFRMKDGSRVNVLIHATEIRQKDTSYLFGAVKNVDQWSSLANELDHTRTRYMDLIELLPAVLFECNHDLDVIFMNASGLREIGENVNAGRSLSLTDFVRPVPDVDLAEWIHDAASRAIQTRLEVEVQRKEGSNYRALLTMSPMPASGEQRGYLGVLVDLTDQKEVQDRLSKLSMAVEQSPSLVLITDKAGHIEYVNRSFTRLTGFTFEEAIGRTPRILKSGAVSEETYRTMWNTILAGREWRTEILNRKKNGETYWQRSTISPLFNETGEISHFLEVAEDITREKELESELFQSQKMEAIGHLAGGIAHDFNNMLTVIMGVGELLRERMDDTEELRGYVDSILSAARKSASLTHQLLAFSRKQLLHPELIDINAVIRDAEKLLRRIVGDNIRIRTSFQDDIGAALLDQSQLHQIILNLVVNAREAIVGSGTIDLQTARFENDSQLILSSGKLAPGRYVRLVISDTGCGMDEETVSHIFEPFYTTKSNGTGLGLATVYGIVQQSNGQIDLMSRLNEGTEFRIYFPIVSKTTDAGDGEHRTGVDRRGSETIFVVEDEETVRRFVSEVLSDNGYTTLLAESAEQALAQWPEVASEVDLLLTDVVLPQQDGVHLYRSLRESRSGLPVVFMSGYTDDSSNILREIADGRLLLPKPFGADELVSFVRRALDEAVRR